MTPLKVTHTHNIFNSQYFIYRLKYGSTLIRTPSRMIGPNPCLCRIDPELFQPDTESGSKSKLLTSNLVSLTDKRVGVGTGILTNPDRELDFYIFFYEQRVHFYSNHNTPLKVHKYCKAMEKTN